MSKISKNLNTKSNTDFSFELYHLILGKFLTDRLDKNKICTILSPGTGTKLEEVNCIQLT